MFRDDSVLFNVNHKKLEVSLFVQNNERVLDVAKLHLVDGSLKGSVQSVSVSDEWLNIRDTCRFVSKDFLVCVDAKSISIDLLNINLVLEGKNSTFESFPLTSFGLKSDEVPQNMKINSYIHEMTSETPFFSLDLGSGNGFVVFKVDNMKIKLVKILPKVSKLTISPTDLKSDRSQTKYAAFALIPKPETVKKDSDNPDEKQFKVAAFDLDSWQELKSWNGHFVVKSSSAVIVDRFEILPFLNSESHQQQKHYKILITTEDERILLLSPQGKISWIREEALSSIISTQFIDFPLSELDASIEQAFGQSMNIMTQFTARISSQIYQLQTYLASLVIDISDLLTPLDPNIRKQETDSGISILEETDGKKFTRDYFGLHKMIVVLTESGKVFSLDNLSGKIIWSFYDPELRHHIEKSGIKKMPMHVQRPSKYYPYPAVCTILTKSGLLLSFDPMAGKVVEKLKIGSDIKQLMLMSHIDETHLKPLIYIMANNRIGIYPKTSLSVLASNRDKYFMLTADVKTNILKGVSLDELADGNIVARVAWTLKLPVTNSCSDCATPLNIHFKRQTEVVHSQGRVLGDRNVLYKYLNPNLAAVVTESEDDSQGSESSKKSHNIDLFLVDAVTGRVIYSSSHKRSKGPVHVIHSENSIIYSYYNEKHRRTEISSIDLYDGLTQVNSGAFSSFERMSPQIEHNTFIFPTGMRTMVDTQTEKGITNKHVLIGLPSGGLLELPKAFLDPRRPINPTMEHREEGLIPYMPELPIPSEGLINYNKSLILLDTIEVAPAGLESTCLVFTTGLDIFYTRVTPSKTFDILKDDFDHLLIAAVLVLLISMGYISKWLAARKHLKAAWT